MPYFLSPKIIFGKDVFKRLASELQGKGSRAVLITDKTVVKFSEELLKTLRGAGYECKVWDGVKPDPTISLAIEAGKFLLDFEPQWVIGFGGGSAIDTAKAAWVLYERPDLISSDLTRSVLPKTKLNLRSKARFLSVPTTSGTGADVTWVAVLTDTEKKRKVIFAHNDIVPDISVLDAGLTKHMPGDLTASTGLDVLGHAIDGYISRQRTDFSDGLCLQAMKIAFEWLPRAFHDPSNLAAREKMQNAATIAGLGFSNSNTGLSHALAHSVGALMHIGHGRAVGIALPYSLEYVASNPPVSEELDTLGRLNTAARFVNIESDTVQERVQAFIQKIRDLAREIGEPLSLREAGVTEGQMHQGIQTLVKIGSSDPNMYTTPCECDGEKLEQLFLKMWEGK